MALSTTGKVAIACALLVGIPFLFTFELALLMFAGVRWLPPLSFMLNTTPLAGDFDASVLGAHPTISPALVEQMEKVNISDMVWWRPKGTVAERVRAMTEVMIEYNTASTTADVPEDMQGVFWMQGNKIPEELVSLSYAKAEVRNGRFLVTKVNSALSWSYLDSDFGEFIAAFQESPTASGVQVFDYGSSAVQNGRIYSINSLDYEDINWLTSIGKWTMERLPGPGVSYKRGCYWFDQVFGEKLEFGSYTLRKIMNTDKSPVQPAYDDFVMYMATTRKGLNMIMPAPPADQEHAGFVDAHAPHV